LSGRAADDALALRAKPPRPTDVTARATVRGVGLEVDAGAAADGLAGQLARRSAHPGRARGGAACRRRAWVPTGTAVVRVAADRDAAAGALLARRWTDAVRFGLRARFVVRRHAHLVRGAAAASALGVP